MDIERLESYLERTLEDGRLSRGERRALREIFLEVDLESEEKSAYLNRVFRVGRGALDKWSEKEVLDWLLGLTKTLVHAQAPTGRRAEVYFEPADDCAAVIRELIRSSRRTVDICVFTLTDDRVSNGVLEAHRRGVEVRIVSDDLKSFDRGSDIRRMAAAGVPIRLDRLPDHMHHKFAVFDREVAVTGSYNWTRGAAEKNHENILVTDDPRLVQPYLAEHERLWEQFDDGRS